MKVIYWYEQEVIDFVTKMLQDDTIVMGTSDTVLGLLADTSKKGLQKLNSIKRRSDKPYLILVADKEKGRYFIAKRHLLPIETIMDLCWPGPITLIFRVKQSLPDFLKLEYKTIALRVPDHAGLRQLLPNFTGLFSTSANISGHPIPSTIAEVDQEIKRQISYVVVDTEEKVMKLLPSTILDCSGEHIIIVREGAYLISKLRQKITCPGTRCLPDCL